MHSSYDEKVRDLDNFNTSAFCRTRDELCQVPTPDPVGGGVLCSVLEDSIATRAILSEAPSCFGDIVVVFVGGSGSSFHSIPRLRLNPSES